MKKALLIGINYAKAHKENSGISQLYGCINDALGFANVLMDAYDYDKKNIKVLRDDFETKAEYLPTRENIMKNLAEIIEASKDSSELSIYYAGHGSNVWDNNSDEKDRKDEILVPCDIMTNGFIRDDEIFNLLKLAKCPVYVFFDCCNSGTACDLPWKFEFKNNRLYRSLESKQYMLNKQIFMMSGCRDDQVSYGISDYEYGRYAGAFSTALCTCLRYNKHNVSLFKLYIDICRWMKDHNYPEIPCFSSSNPLPFYKMTRATKKSNNRKFYSKQSETNFYNK